MSKYKCLNCASENLSSESRIVRSGRYYRKSDRKWVSRFRCTRCGGHFSQHSTSPSVRQKKRHLNKSIDDLFCSGNSQRRIARLLRISRTTVARKLVFLGEKALRDMQTYNLSKPPSEIIEFDDMETFEHTKCKPLSITLAVEHKTRRILGFEVCQMPAKGKLAKISVKKYGPRQDHRRQARERLFQTLVPLIASHAQIKSDENPHYPSSVRKYFPKATHLRFKGQRGSIVGQGELKKVRFDPLFSLNHTCAMLRANVNRLFRRTWCTTKKPERLRLHIAMYAQFHNLTLI